jgi:DNA-binding GntR family transcriptional regulator
MKHDTGKGDPDEIADTPLRRQVEEGIRKLIVSGELQPGDRLRERELGVVFKVSRTSLREALRHIEAEGLVTSEPNRGPVVAELSYEDAEEIYEVREILEAMACSGFAEHATSAQLERARTIFVRLRETAQLGDFRAVLEIKRELYDVLLEGCGNKVVRQMLTQLHNRIMLLRRMSLSAPDRLPDTVAEVGVLMDALIARDTKAAWNASAHHVRQAARIALKIMRKQSESKPLRVKSIKRTIQ